MRDWSLLDREILYSLNEPKVLFEPWRGEYNKTRPHSSCEYGPPALSTISADKGRTVVEACSAPPRSPQLHVHIINQRT